MINRKYFSDTILVKAISCENLAHQLLLYTWQSGNILITLL